MTKKLAIVTNYKEDCGIASYSGAIVNGFESFSDFFVKVFPIDTSLSQLKFKKAVIKRHHQFKSIGQAIAEYDFVNIQFENGIFGQSHSECIDNLKALLNKRAKFVITMHTADVYEGTEFAGGILEAISEALKFKLLSSARIIFHRYKSNFMTLLFRTLKDFENVSLVVHTKREQDLIKNYHDFYRVYSHPLVFMSREKSSSLVRSEAIKEDIRRTYGLDKDDVIISIYGFLSRYKGHLTAVKALRDLPSNYKLLIAGSQHPKSIARQELVNLDINDVLSEIEGVNLAERLPEVTYEVLSQLDLSDRVRFLGFIDDANLVNLIINSDINIYPYIETGQSASGPASLGLEVGGNLLMSNAHVFNELSRYAPNSFERFDIGNYKELAQKIQRLVEHPFPKKNSFNAKYDLEENIGFYVSLFEESN